MKLILHIGSPKTGTTALQQVLANHRPTLAAEGYLYPNLDDRPHHRVLALCVRWDCPPRSYRKDEYVAPKRLRQMGERALARLGTQAKETGAHTVILSSEGLFKTPADRVGAFAAGLRDIADEVLVVCYLRDPVDYSVARLGQILRGTGEIPPLKAPPYVQILRSFAAHLPVNVVAYGREQLLGGDIVADFSSRFLPGVKVLSEGYQSNVSPSAEALDILSSYGQHASFGAGGKSLRTLLGPIDETVAGRRSLKPREEVRRAIYAMFAPQYEVLRNEFGLHLPGPPDVTALESDVKALRVNRPADVLEIDWNRREKMTMLVMQSLLRRKAPSIDAE